MATITGNDAIEYKMDHPDAVLNKYSDPIEGERINLTVSEAEDVIREDPSLIYIETTD